MVFHDGLRILEKRAQNRFYTTATSFAQDFGNVFHNGIVSQPAPPPEQPLSSELNKPAVTDIRERRRLAKRIIKTLQPQLQVAVRAEADLSGKSADILIRDLDQLLEMSIQSNADATSVSVGDTGSQVDVESKNDGEVQMGNGEEFAMGNGRGINETEEVEMKDVLSPEEDTHHLSASSIVNSLTKLRKKDTSLTEVNGNLFQSKLDHSDSHKIGKHHDTANNAGTVQILNPPTPPLSNGDSSSGHNSNFLVNGGIPWFLEEFHPDGTTIVQEKWTGRDAVARSSEDLSDMDEATLNGLLAVGEPEVPVPPVAVKTKKAKSKRSRRR